MRICQRYLPAVIDIDSVPNDIIASILRKAPYSITTEKIIDRIIGISKGNPRLAIIAATVFNKNKGTTEFTEAGDIYEAYFEDFTNDHVLFANKLTTKILGLVSFFYMIDMDAPLYQDLLTRFKLDDKAFRQAVEMLHDLEVIDLDENNLKFTEQGFASYFFYKAFIKDQILSFAVLMDAYFQHWHSRMQDAVEGAIDLFGRKRVLDNTAVITSDYWQKVSRNADNGFQYLAVFGRFFPEQVFAYTKTTIRKLPLAGEFNIWFKNIPYNNVNSPRLLKLLEPLYNLDDNELLLEAVSLSLEYAGRRNDIYKEVISAMNRALHVRRTDIDNHLNRQKVIYAYFKKFSVTDKLHLYAFYHIFMELVFSGQRFNDQYYKQNGENWELIPEIKSIRSGLWSHFIENYDALDDIKDHILIAYLDGLQNINNLVIMDDFPQLLQLIEKKLDPTRWTDCLFVKKLEETIIAIMEVPQGLAQHAERFTNKTYELAIVLAPATYFHKLGDERNYREIEENKRSTIAEATPVEDLTGFKQIFLKLIDIVQSPWTEKYHLRPMLEYVILNIFKSRVSLGFEVMEYYLKHKKIFYFNPPLLFNYIFSLSHRYSVQLLKLINECHFPEKESWLMNYYYFYPEDRVTKAVAAALLTFYSSAKTKQMVYPETLEKFSTKDPLFFKKAFTILSDKFESDEAFKYELEHHFFTKIPAVIKRMPALCKRVYLQQDDQNRQYDLDGTDLMAIMEADTSLLTDLIDKMLVQDSLRLIGNNKHFPRLWEVDHAQQIIYRALTNLIKTTTYRSSDDIAGIFFINLPQTSESKAMDILKRLILEFKEDLRAVNITLDTVRHYMRNHFIELVKCFITINPDIKLFKELEWRHHGYLMNAAVSRVALELKQLNEMYDAIAQMNANGLYEEHLEELSLQISQRKKEVLREQKSRFH